MNDVITNDMAEKLLDKAKAQPETKAEGTLQDKEYSDDPKGN